VPAAYFDGRQATRHEVLVTISGGEVRVNGDGIARSAPLTAVDITEPLGTAPRLIRFADGAFCSIEQQAALASLLAADGVMPARVSKWEESRRWVAVATVAFVLLLVVAYRYGLPAAAGAAAAYVPAGVVDLISDQALTTFDSGIFSDTTLAPTRQASLRRRFEALRLPGGADTSHEVLFRKSDLLGANALALPSGTLIVTDDLVALSDEDDDVIAVLAHEAGHVRGRHGLRQLFQNSALAVALTWFIGDVSVLAAAAPTALLQAKYSRDFEREADAFALSVLDDNGIARNHFARMLERLEQSARERGARVGDGTVLGYLSSHPVTQERLQSVGLAGR
jgi:Zn-dependent protease with chaperone function